MEFESAEVGEMGLEWAFLHLLCLKHPRGLETRPLSPWCPLFSSGMIQIDPLKLISLLPVLPWSSSLVSGYQEHTPLIFRASTRMQANWSVLCSLRWIRNSGRHYWLRVWTFFENWLVGGGSLAQPQLLRERNIQNALSLIQKKKKIEKLELIQTIGVDFTIEIWPR